MIGQKIDIWNWNWNFISQWMKHITFQSWPLPGLIIEVITAILEICPWRWEQRKKNQIYRKLRSFFRFVDKRAIYRLGIISLAHAPVHVTDFPVVNVHVDELSSARIWQHKLCATFTANVNINYRLPIKVYYHICTLRHITIEINEISTFLQFKNDLSRSLWLIYSQ